MRRIERSYTDVIGAGRLRFFCPILLAMGFVLVLILATSLHTSSASTEDDRRAVSALDKEYQAAVKRNDAVTMARILADNFTLVTGSGKTYTKADMLEDAKKGDSYEHNDEEVQTVRVWGDTAVVTAKLWEKFTSEGKSYDHKFWFSDTYVRTPAGWKYVFGQSSLPLSDSSEKGTVEGDKRAVTNLENEWLAALNDANLDAIANILAADFMRPAPDYGRFVTKEDLLNFYRSHLAAHPSNHRRIEDLTLTLYGTTALARGAVITRNPEGRIISKLLFTDVFVRSSRKWQAVSAQENTATISDKE